MKIAADNNNSHSYTIKVARSIEEVEQYRDSWESMQWHPNADIDFYITIVNKRQEIIRPHVIVLYNDNNPEAMVIGRIEEKRIDIKIGYKVFYRPKLRSLTIVYGGILGNQSAFHVNVIITELLDTVKRGDADIIFFSNLPLDSEMYRLAKSKPGFFSRDHISQSNLHWKMTLPGSIDAFLQSMKRKHRYWLNRLPRVLEKEYPGKVAYKEFHNKADIDKLCSEADNIARKTYQRGLGAGFINNDETRQGIRLSAERGWLRSYFAYINNEPAAFWIGTLYGETFYLSYTGYDPIYKKYEPGTILFVRIIEDLCDNSIYEIDFGFGDAFYKKRFGNKNWEEASVIIFSPSIKNIIINLSRLMSVSLSKLFEKILRQTNFYEKIKKYWRIRLTQKSKNNNENF